MPPTSSTPSARRTETMARHTWKQGSPSRPEEQEPTRTYHMAIKRQTHKLQQTRLAASFCLLPLQTSRCGKKGVAEAKTQRTNSLRGFWEGRKSARLVAKVGRFAGAQPTVVAAAAGRMDAGADAHADAGCRLQEPLIFCAERVSQAFPGKHRRTEGANATMAGKRRHLATLFSCSPASLARGDGHGLAQSGNWCRPR